MPTEAGAGDGQEVAGECNLGRYLVRDVREEEDRNRYSRCR